MGPNFIPAVIVGVGTFLFSTILQGVDPDIALGAGAVFGIIYWLGGDFFDEVFS